MEKNDAKPCVTAIIDLSGFSSHLEISNYDIRTEIGISAINRIQVLEDALILLERERHLEKSLYPQKFKSLRFNDSIYFTMDLADSLIPSVGQLVRDDISGNEMDDILNGDYSENTDKDLKKIKIHFERLVYPLCKFVGFVSRVHSFICFKENEKHFPGVKTVIAFGLRKPFFGIFNKKEDYFSANFSISTAYLASKELRGAKFFVDNNILQMICYNSFAKNLIKYGQVIKEPSTFDPNKIYPEITSIPSEHKTSEVNHLEVFRKLISFRSMNFHPLGYLQVVPSLMPYLKGTKQTTSKAHISLRILKSIKEEYTIESKKNSDLCTPNYAILNVIKNDIEENLNQFVKEIRGEKTKSSYISAKEWLERNKKFRNK